MKSVLFISFLFWSCLAFCQQAKDGNYTTSTTGEQVNTYTYLTATASSGDNTLTVDDNSMTGAQFGGGLAQGDLLLIIQMQGVAVNAGLFSVDVWGGNYTFPNDPTWGEVTNYYNCGNHEFVEVSSVSGASSIELNCGLEFDYDDSSKVQVIRVPRWDTLNVAPGTSIEAPDWNGQTGGIVALEVLNMLQLNGDISASESGFRGGYVNVAKNSGYGGGNYGSFDELEGSVKGEGIWGDFNKYTLHYSLYCRGAAANAGGGGNNHNAGGGGGANAGIGTYTGLGMPNTSNPNYVTAWNLETAGFATATSSGGGRGGYSSSETNQNPLTTPPGDGSWNFDQRRPTGGLGGRPLDYSTGRIFMGGGGGAGDYNDNQAGAGGSGGGIVYIRSYGDFSGSGSITSNGQNGFDSQASNPGFFGLTGVDGAGGAGGGGTIIIENDSVIPASININAVGGSGGNNFMLNGALGPTIVEAYGPGGGGGGGYVSITSGTPTIDVSGGASGETNSGTMSDFPMNGATGGAEGLSNSDAELFQLIPINDTICNTGAANLEVTVIGTPPGGSVIEWYTQPTGGAVINTGTTFTTPTLTTNTSYYVGVCPGTFRVEVQALISPSITIDDAALVVTDETCSGNDGSITGLTATGGNGNLSYDWNGSPSVSEDTTNIVAGNYTLTVTDENGCTAVYGPINVSDGGGPVVDLSNLTVQDEQCDGVNGSIIGIQVSGNSPFSFSWDGANSTGIDTTGLAAGSYTLQITDNGGCTTSAGPFTINNQNTLTVDTTGFIITPTACDVNSGEITGITASGANPVVVEWNGTTQSIVDLTGAASGFYTLTVTDDNGCVHTSGPYEITQFPDPTIDTSSININVSACNTPSGSISGINVNGNGPYTYLWNGQSGSLNLSGASPGDYTLQVIDDNGCTASVGPINVGELNGPDLDTSNLSVDTENCGQSDGAINGISIDSGNPPYTFEWNGVSNVNQLLSDASAGSYTLIVTDAGGCTSTVGPVEIPLNEGPQIDTTSMQVQDEYCNLSNGLITGVVVAGGAGNIQTNWEGFPMGQDDITGLSAGTYDFLAVDDAGCSDSISVVINDLGELEADFNWMPELPAVGGAVTFAPVDEQSLSGFSFFYQNEEIPTNYTFNSPGSIEITMIAEDMSGCQDTVVKTVSISGDLIIPNVFTPNGDNDNDFFVIDGLYDPANTSVTIHDRWGKLIYQNDSYNNDWGGVTKDGKIATEGVYIYLVTDPKGQNYHGQVSILR